MRLCAWKAADYEGLGILHAIDQPRKGSTGVQAYGGSQ